MENENDYEQDEINQEYQEPIPERLPGNEPNAADFTDYDKYTLAVIDWRINQASEQFRQQTGQIGQSVADAVRQSLGQPPQPRPDELTPFSDDPHREQRTSLINLSLEYSREAIMCGEAGKTAEAQRWRERQRDVEKDLAKLPPTPQEKWAQDMSDHVDDVSIQQLFDPKLKDSPAWDHERMLADAPIVIARSNKNAKTVLRLPAEVSAWGDVEPCKPANMMKIELAADDMKRFKAQVYNGEVSDPDSIFRKSWAALHKLGFSSQATRAFPEKGETTDKGKPPERMNAKEFAAWRERTGKQRTQPVMFGAKKWSK